MYINIHCCYAYIVSLLLQLYITYTTPQLPAYSSSSVAVGLNLADSSFSTLGGTKS